MGGGVLPTRLTLESKKQLASVYGGCSCDGLVVEESVMSGWCGASDDGVQPTGSFAQRL